MVRGGKEREKTHLKLSGTLRRHALKELLEHLAVHLALLLLLIGVSHARLV